MLASGSWNDGAGWPTCSMAPAFRSTVESILAHFDVTLSRPFPRCGRVHARPLAAPPAAGPAGDRGLRRPALAARSARARGLGRGAIAARSAPRRRLDARARADRAFALQATS